LDNAASGVATNGDRSWFASAVSDSFADPGTLSIRRWPIVGVAPQIASPDWTGGCGS
jgi:hypothetical protein